MSTFIIKHHLFRIHCFNKYGKNKNDDCPDLEVTYYIECSEKIENEEPDLEKSQMRRKNHIPIICQHESINTPIPKNKTTGLQEIEITIETPNTLDQSTAPLEDLSTEETMTTLDDGILEPEKVEITTETPNTLDQWTAPIEDSRTEKMMTTLNDDIFEPHEVGITTETPNTLDEWTASQEDSGTGQMMTTLKDGIFETLETAFETFDLTTKQTGEINELKSEIQYILFYDNTTYIYAGQQSDKSSN